MVESEANPKENDAMTDSTVDANSASPQPPDDSTSQDQRDSSTSTSSSSTSAEAPAGAKEEEASSSEGKDGGGGTETAEDDKRTKEEREREEKDKAEAEKKRIEELKRKYADWPFRGIKDPHDNDVMYGRGGGTNHHPGNKLYRKMVEDRKLEYVNSKRLDKPLVALEIIRLWRAQLPPGRFLKLDEKTGLWSDVGDKKAREKTSQALREKAPLIRKQQEEDEMEEGGVSDRSDRRPYDPCFLVVFRSKLVVIFRILVRGPLVF
jgi:hypothetical protein